MSPKLVDEAKLKELSQKYSTPYIDPDSGKALLDQPAVDQILRLGKKNGVPLEELLADLQDLCKADPRVSKVTAVTLGRHLRAGKTVKPSSKLKAEKPKFDQGETAKSKESKAKSNDADAGPSVQAEISLLPADNLAGGR